MTGLGAIRAVTWAAIAALVIVIGFAGWQWQKGGSPIAGIAIGGPFQLTDQHGATVTEASLKGHPSAMFFGYTFCPDVCPTTLSDLTQWMAKLGPEGDRLQVYFVTVDPERDTQDQMAAYLQAFDPRFLGLTGTRPAIDKMLAEYRVYSRKMPLDGGSYTMDHTAAVYLLDADGRLAGTLDYNEGEATALAKLKRLIGGA